MIFCAIASNAWRVVKSPNPGKSLNFNPRISTESEVLWGAIDELIESLVSKLLKRSPNYRDAANNGGCLRLRSG